MTSKDDISNISYQKSQDWVEHYSNLILKVRISVSTLSVVIIALLLSPHSDIGIGPVTVGAFEMNLDAPTVKSILALIYALSVSLFFNFEYGYYARLKRAIESGMEIERRFKIVGNCSYYETKNVHNRVIYLLYGFLVVIFALLFSVLGLKARFDPFWTILAAAIPIAVFAAFTRLRRDG